MSHHRLSTLARVESAIAILREIAEGMQPGEVITKGALWRMAVRRDDAGTMSESVFREALNSVCAARVLEASSVKSVRRPVSTEAVEVEPAPQEDPESAEARIARLERMMERICMQLGVSTE